MLKIYIVFASFLFFSQYLAAQMVLKYKITQPNITIKLPLNGTIDVSVDWGDGTAKQAFDNTNSYIEHKYLNSGLFTVTIVGKLSRFGLDSDYIGRNLISVESWEGLGLTSLRSAFRYAENLVSVPSSLPTTVSDISEMFYGATIFNQPIESWNTTNVTNMSGLFEKATSFNQPLSGWNTAQVTSMSSMFSRATSFNQPIGNWNTGKVIDMVEMFALATAFNQPLDNWNTADVVYMRSMFAGATSFNQPIDKWNTARVWVMDGMFGGAISFNQPIGAWNTAGVIDMRGMFAGATSFNQSIGAWNTAKVNDMRKMFAYATSFNQPIGTWNTQSVAYMEEMFYEATSFNQPIGTWNTWYARYMGYMFYGATSFNQPIGTWNTANVTDMKSMFEGATSFNQPIGTWNTVNVTNMRSLFKGATSFNQPIGTWNIKTISSKYDMFLNAGLCTENYDNLLNGWAPQVVWYYRIYFDGGSSKYSAASAAARASLINIGWDITDGGSGLDNTKCPLITNTEVIQGNIQPQKLAIYPNPSAGAFTVSGQMPLGVLRIYNAVGTMLYEIQENGLEQTINLSDEKCGLYFLRTENQSIQLLKE